MAWLIQRETNWLRGLRQTWAQARRLLAIVLCADTAMDAALYRVSRLMS
jgi:hypothetical protein